MESMLPLACIDVDLTLVDLDTELLPGVEKQLRKLVKKYKLMAWSAGGEEYARAVLRRAKIDQYFTHIVGKPFVIIDDEPDSIMKKARIVQIHGPKTWDNLWDKIFGKDTSDYE